MERRFLPESISLRLPERLLDEVRATSEAGKMPYQRFFRMAIEGALLERRLSRFQAEPNRNMLRCSNFVMIISQCSAS
jgi:hypothetical protein